MAFGIIENEPAEDILPTDRIILLPFNRYNRLGLVAESPGHALLEETWDTPVTEPSTLDQRAEALARRRGWMETPQFQFRVSDTLETAVYFIKAEGPASEDLEWISLEKLGEQLKSKDEAYPEFLQRHLPEIRSRSIEIPYLNFRRHDFIYKFRSERQRNKNVYHADPESAGLYQSHLCEAIKATRRTKENSSERPACLDFGPIQYYLPSHFGFCLGVQNAIERAYETLAEHPEERVFMLSELIHNPFVNEDLKKRGLRFLQTDKGQSLEDPETGLPYWEGLTESDIVVIPAFGATIEDKRRLIEKGLEINRYDATCMLVEKVWKAAKRYGQAGFTVIIHGKGEHEETKATFSSSARFAPCLVVRNLEEAKTIGTLIRFQSPEARREAFRKIDPICTSGFDPVRDLDKIAVVNQTTLLRNETLKIIDYFERLYGEVYGAEAISERVNGKNRGDTLCYATQVNQDALTRTLEEPIDLALVAGGKNSSNTYQLFRICQDRFGDRAFYVQSEGNVISPEAIEHYHFPYDPRDPKGGTTEVRPFLSSLGGKPREPIRILLTGGASCPDGIIQQIIHRVNQFFDPASLHPIESVLEAIETS